jgi:exodeoxyribonuclease V gamma subunit
LSSNTTLPRALPVSHGPPSLRTMLHLHRSERADVLVEALARLLGDPLADPMAREVVAVPTRGVERWLTQRLSHRPGASRSSAGTHEDGVCANIDWPFPGRLVEMATSAACGLPASAGWPKDASSDPWNPRRLIWPLLELVDEDLEEDYLRPLAEHLRRSCPAAAGEPLRRFPAVRHLAELYDRYSAHRPEMLLAWIDQGIGVDCSEDERWQAELWRRLRRRVGVPSPAERLATTSTVLAEQPGVLALPPRISVFGLTRLPTSHLRTLEAIAGHREVHLFLLHPSGRLWDKVAAALAETPVPQPSSGAARHLARRDDPTAQLPANPLLRSWARDARELQIVLAERGARGGEHLALPEDAAQDNGATPTLLHLLQADIRADHRPPGEPGPGQQDARPLLAKGDNSVQIHSCHGRARQVEVAREAVLHLLASDPTLEPRDIIVMCPDVELFAPLIQATFGTAGLAGGPELRARLADRSVRQTNPLLGVAAQLLELAGGRVSAPQVLDFASREPVSRRFFLDDERLSRIETWLAGTGIRWGFDDRHRQAWDLQGLGGLATWRAGLDRLLLGAAMAGSGQPFRHVLASDDVSSTEIELVGHLAELVDRLEVAIGALKGPQTVRAWATALIAGTDLLACAEPGDAWQRAELLEILEETASMAGGPAVDGAPLLDLAEATSLLADRLRGRPTRANFRTGDLTICTLVPMRSVPHRAICLLGLDDGLFPRRSEQDGDDLLLARPDVGDRDVPSEDRQLLLDAVLAAKEHLLITYEGRDQHINRRRPPCVPVSELLEVIDRTVRVDDAGSLAHRRVVVEHPLQAFDPRNYTTRALGETGPWRFDSLNLDGARALAGERRQRAKFLSNKLAPLQPGTLQLARLVQFLEHPVRSFLRQRLGLYLAEPAEQLRDELPLDLDALEQWGLGDRLLTSVLDGWRLEEALSAEKGRGLLPPGPLGEDALSRAADIATAVVNEAHGVPDFASTARAQQVDVVLPSGRRITGTVPGVRGETIVRCVVSKLGPKHRLRAWAHFLALSAAYPEQAPGALTIGRGEHRKGRGPLTRKQALRPLGDDPGTVEAAALAYLAVLVDLFDRGMREPLPLYCCTSEAWARARVGQDDPAEAARRTWGSGLTPSPCERREVEHELVLGEDMEFDELLEERPPPDESGPGWPAFEKSRFGRLALRLWAPLLSHEQF